MNIDVSKCMHYDSGNCDNDNMIFKRCCDNDCFYKQKYKLQQSKAKLEKIKEIVSDTDFIVQGYEQPYDLAKDIIQIIESEE